MLSRQHLKRVVEAVVAPGGCFVHVAPEAGEYAYNLFLMSDSYLGCDQEYELPLKVAEAEEEDDEDDDEEEDEED